MLRIACLLLLLAAPLAAALAAPAAVAPTQAGGDAVAGKVAFSRCANCHQVGASARSVFGPQLNGILGRRAASDPGYKYSDAMRKSGIVWNERTLAAFMKAPDKMVPDTKMRFWGISDERQVVNILAYLRSNP